MSSLAKAISVAILMGAAGQAAAVDTSGAVDRALAAIRMNPKPTRLSASDNFAVRGVTVDRNGTEHVRFARTYKGLPVIGGDLVVHSKAGAFRSASLTQAAPLTLSTVPTITGDQAITLAGAKFGTQFEAIPTARLAVYARRATPILTYDVLYVGKAKDGTPVRMHYYVNAANGNVVGQENAVQTGTLPGDRYGTGNPPAPPVVTPATGTGRSLMAGTVPVYTQWNADRRFFEMKDPTRGGTYITDLGNQWKGNGTLVIDGDNKWGNGALTDRNSTAVDAAYGFAKTWDFYKNMFGRLGIAGDGVGAFGAVHYLTGYVNAFWSNDCFCMAFGDGDGGAHTRPLVAIDIMGHEMSHGVTWATAGLIYDKESGGLNEATSDILGTMVEYYANNPVQTPNYLIGEAIYTDGTPALRSMFKPSLDGISDDCYPDGSDPAYLEFFSGTGQYGAPGAGKDMHYTSGVANHFYYLLAEGAVVPDGWGAGTKWDISPDELVCNGNTALAGIGREAAQQIWYRALTVYMTSNTNYAAARVATMNAAGDLYGVGSANQNAVAAAWDAVNVH